MVSLNQSLPLTYESNNKPYHPLLILLHGVGSNEASMFNLANQFPDFHVVSVRAPLVIAEGRYAWFGVKFTPEPIHNATEAEASRLQLVRFIQDLQILLNISPSQTFLGGFSQGAIMTLSVVLTAPELLAGAVAMSGRILQERQQTQPSRKLEHLPVLVTYGQEDTKLPIHHGRRSREVLQPLVALEYREFATGHDINSQTLATIRQWLTTQITEGKQP